MIAAVPIAADDHGLVTTLLAAGLPVDDLKDPGRSFFCIARDDRTLGFGGFEIYGQDALLRSVVVPPAARGQGHGRVVSEAMLREIEAAGAWQVYLLTTTATAFFARLGFVAIARDAAPSSILATRQASAICASANLLTRAI